MKHQSRLIDDGLARGYDGKHAWEAGGKGVKGKAKNEA